MHNRTKKGRIGCKVRIHVNGREESPETFEYGPWAAGGW
jgi:hypothetical protein